MWRAVAIYEPHIHIIQFGIRFCLTAFYRYHYHIRRLVCGLTNKNQHSHSSNRTTSQTLCSFVFYQFYTHISSSWIIKRWLLCVIFFLLLSLLVFFKNIRSTKLRSAFGWALNTYRSLFVCVWVSTVIMKAYECL